MCVFNCSKNSDQKNPWDHSYGLCLPAACKIDHFETAVNDFIRTTGHHAILQIPKENCQLEESVAVWKPIDYATM